MAGACELALCPTRSSFAVLLGRRSDSPGRADALARWEIITLRGALADQKPSGHGALALDFDHATWLELETVFEQLVGCFANMDAAGDAVRLHAARRIDGVAPDIEHELLKADDATDARAGFDANPKIDLTFAARAAPVEARANVQCHPRNGRGVPGSTAGNPRDAHPVVANSPDLFDAVPLGGAVELGEDFVQELDHLFRLELVGQRREADDVREEDRRCVVGVRDRTLAGLQARRDLAGKDVQQQPLGSVLLSGE